ncbi:MAG TPA: hypothetical protein PLK37_07680 [Terricaulis sp.]|nr:hypothetical protein [Terricaulis sp.]
MQVRSFKLWRGVGAAALLAAAACGPVEQAKEGESAEAPAPTPSATPAPAAGGEAGEAGASTAYAGVRGAQLTALRLQHLKGFLLVAERVARGGAADEAAALVGQGVLEVYDHAPAAEFGALNIAPVRAAAESPAQIEAALAAISAAAPADADHAALAARMVDIAAGLYQGVVQPDFVDSIEYQHSMGAALAARDALVAGEAALKAKNAAAYDAALAEVDRMIALWPNVTPSASPAAYRDVLAASSRVRLALSPFL